MRMDVELAIGSEKTNLGEPDFWIEEFGYEWYHSVYEDSLLLP